MAKSMTKKDNKKAFELHTVDLKKGALIFRALNNKLRASIIKLIHQKKQITVTEIYTKLRIEQSVASQHLAILRQAEVVNTNRNGKSIIYTLNYARLQEIEAAALKLTGK